jgi:lipase maturation factor/vitamin K-dependent gamma-carboxylase-like protein
MKAMRWPRWSFGSGAAVGALFSRVFALVSLGAWLSLGTQIQLLVGSRGLLPYDELMRAVRGQPGISFLDLPTVFWWLHGDAALSAGVALGAALSLAALVGLGARLCFGLSTALYLSFALIGRDFLSFQWDNLLIECGLLAAFLPADAPAPLVHFLFRTLLFKLYFESGLAKWQSPLGDWRDGSAMTFYYETAPLPTRLAFYAHHLPAWWHHFESRATLALELVVPFAIFGPRRARLGAALAFTLFQLANAATANYGFFCYLAAALNLFLLDDADIERARACLAPAVAAVRRLAARWLAQPARQAPAQPLPEAPAQPARQAPADPREPSLRAWIGRAAALLFVAVSLLDGLNQFTEPGRLVTLASPLLELDQRLRLVNSYHLFAAITRERIEPELQTLAPAGPVAGDQDDAAWTTQELRHKPGDPRRAPDFVAPHQPRVDFQLWFYGLAFRRREPAYVSALVEKMCDAPAAVQPLFRAPLPEHPAAVRIVYWQYWFASPTEARATGSWWRRARLAASRAIPCAEQTP